MRPGLLGTPGLALTAAPARARGALRVGSPDATGSSTCPLKRYADDLSATVRDALETTRAIAVCPFHSDATIRVGDDAAESHAYERAKSR
jgi:hypothetical protein